MIRTIVFVNFHKQLTETSLLTLELLVERERVEEELAVGGESGEGQKSHESLGFGNAFIGSRRKVPLPDAEITRWNAT